MARGLKTPGARLVTVVMVALLGCRRGAPPNIVIVSVDTLNRSAIRAFDRSAPRLPAFDALARESLRFDHAVAPASWTLPSHGSLMTGLYPDRHGATHRLVGLAPGLPTLAKDLKHAGYETVAFTGGGYVDGKYGFARGFDRYDACTTSKAKTCPGDTGPTGRLERGVSLLAARHADDRPLFLFLHSFLVHDYSVSAPASGDAAGEELVACLTGERRCPAETWAELRRRYARQVARFDTALARLLDVLHARGLWDSTILVVLGDHGEGFDVEHGRIHHGGRLHEDVIRVPLLVRVPGISPRTVATPASLVDVMPTLLDLVGLRPRPDLDGISLAPLLRGGVEPPERPLFAMEHAFFWTMDRRGETEDVQARPLLFAVIRGTDWYIRGHDREELYDLARDPQQRDDRMASESPAALRAIADARAGSTARGLAVVDEHLQGRLRALGYVR